MGTIRIPLSSSKYPDLFAIVDEADAELVSRFRWRVVRAPHTFYAQTTPSSSGGIPVQMHRMILGLHPGDPDVDHKDGDGLNNVRSNLRLCNTSLNQANRKRLRAGTSSQYRGVTWNKAVRKWQAAIKVREKSIYLGLFASEEDAARAYNEAATKHFGEFASLNVIGGTA